MNVLLDTSVLVAALVGPHPLHERAFTWLRQASSGKITLLVAAHALVELYAVLTRYPSAPKISPEQAARLIMSSVAKHATIIPLGVADHVAVIQELGDTRPARRHHLRRAPCPGGHGWPGAKNRKLQPDGL